jgi:hypothetical protein
MFNFQNFTPPTVEGALDLLRIVSDPAKYKGMLDGLMRAYDEAKEGTEKFAALQAEVVAQQKALAEHEAKVDGKSSDLDNRTSIHLVREAAVADRESKVEAREAVAQKHEAALIEYERRLGDQARGIEQLRQLLNPVEIEKGAPALRQ